MKNLFLYIILGLTIVFSYLGMTSKYRNVPIQAIVINSTPANLVTPSPHPTNTLIPSATIDYQQTAIIAQQTADEARRVNAVVTAQFEQRVQAQLQMTADYEKRNQQIFQWTAIAANTIIPLTATQQAVMNTQIPQRNQLLAAQLTATQYAPTQIIVMAQAESIAKFAPYESSGRIFVEFGMGIFVLMFAARLFFNILAERREQDIQEPEAPQTETVIQVEHKTPGQYSKTRQVFPGTPEQLNQLAEGLTQQIKTLAINKWEAKGEMGREAITRIRYWLMEPREIPFVVKTADHRLEPTDELIDFLWAWLDKGALEAGYEFEAPHFPEVVKSPNHDEKEPNVIMAMVNHGHGNGGGGTVEAVAV